MASEEKGEQAPAAPVPPANTKRLSKGVLIGAAVVAALVVAAVVGVALSDSDSSGGTKAAVPHAEEVQQLFDDIPQSGNRLGDNSAPAMMIAYTDVDCRPCRELQTKAMPEVISRYVRTGKLLLITRLTAATLRGSEAGRLATIAAGRQDKFFNMLQLLYLNDPATGKGRIISPAVIKSTADSIPGLQAPLIVDTVRSLEPSRQAAKFDKQARIDGVRTAPVLFVGKSAGGALRKVKLATPSDARALQQAVEASLG